MVVSREMAARKIRLTIQYDGSGYNGWQTQPGFKTIQETLNQAVSSLVGRKVTVHGASRTDAGVSALGQVCLIEVDSPIPTENFPKAISDRLPPEIVVTDAVEVDKQFDLIGDVKSKLYRYTIYNGRYRPVLEIKHCWHIPTRLDEKAMNEATKLLVGTKDFKSFASAKDNRESTIRTIFRCEVTGDNDWIYIDIEGDGFLYNMARNIAGTLADIGLGRWQPKKITGIIETKDRTAAGQLAPAEGLCLLWIKY
jgi:tRNA pseudouridine38-40 synthase